ncbi:MAG TPA: radical SAM protein, partial [Bryobacteraceae bacterium]|nr:radical SAM protein [Bryobacteraceae bacterium]
MHKPIKYAEKVVTAAAGAAWTVFDKLNQIHQNPSFTPKWSDKPLLKSYQKTKPPLGWPRETDSLCPRCIPEIRKEIVDGKQDYKILLKEKVGEIKAKVIERDGKILMVKDCPVHGHFEDVMAIDTAFFKHLEEVFPGRDILAHNDEKLHNHGSSTIKHGRGSVLTVDLTNRCNMMCDPCFMDANQVGFVHELSWEDIQTLLDNAISIKPRRQMSVQFSGGEPTLSPYFLDAVRYSRKVGYNSVQAATNGIEFAKDFAFAKKAAEAGLRYAYLQFDGIGNAANAHRKVGNLFDVKLQAIENLHNAGVEIVPVTTILNGINNEQVGRIVEFALDNPKKISFCSFQPVSFTGRDEAITDDRRHAQRYTLSHLAHDVRDQTGIGEPARDWFPISFMSTFSDWADLVHGPQHEWGQLSCGCHPNCGVGLAIMVDKETKERAAVTSFLNAERLSKDVARVNDAARGKFLSVVGVALSLLRNYDPFKSPRHFKLTDLLTKFDKCFGATGRNYGKVSGDRTIDDIQKRRKDRWNFLFIAGMWFQDLFNYDFRRTEQCIIPYATQE